MEVDLLPGDPCNLAPPFWNRRRALTALVLVVYGLGAVAMWLGWPALVPIVGPALLLFPFIVMSIWS